MTQEKYSFFTIVPSISLLFLSTAFKCLSIPPCLISTSVLKESKYLAERVRPSQRVEDGMFCSLCSPQRLPLFSPPITHGQASLTACFPLVPPPFILGSQHIVHRSSPLIILREMKIIAMEGGQD